MKLFWTCVAVCLATAATAETPAFDTDIAKATCATEWPDDFAMQKFCVDQDRDGHAQFSTIAEQTAAVDAFDPATLTACLEEWLPKWSMAGFCAEQNVQGLSDMARTLQELPEDVAAPIFAKCRSEWPKSHSMQAFCTEQQANGWRALQD